MDAAPDFDAIDRRLIVVEQALPVLDHRVAALERHREENRHDHVEIRQAISGLRSEMQTEFATVRSEMAAEFAAVRSEMAAEFATVRSEMAAEFAAVRSESQAEFAAVRSDMQTMRDEIRSEMFVRFAAVDIRFSQIEARLAAIEKDIEWMRGHFLGRAEFQAEINKLTWKIYGFGTGLGTILVSAVFFIARNVH